jgi:hypothetical protein
MEFFTVRAGVRKSPMTDLITVNTYNTLPACSNTNAQNMKLSAVDLTWLISAKLQKILFRRCIGIQKVSLQNCRMIHLTI